MKLHVYLRSSAAASFTRSEARNVSIVRYLKRPKIFSLDEAIASCGDVGNDRGKEIVYKHFYGAVLAVTRRYVKDEYDSEELANETFIRAFNKASTFQNINPTLTLERAFRAWLCRIAANMSIDFIRARKTFVPLDDIGDAAMPVEVKSSASDLYVEDILRLLEQLPDIQRVIFNMYEVEGYSHEEVGKLLGIPESTSRTYLSRAKQKLKKLYVASFGVK